MVDAAQANKMGSFVILSMSRAIKWDIKDDRDDAEDTVYHAMLVNPEKIPDEQGKQVEYAKHYVDWCYGKRSRPEWLELGSNPDKQKPQVGVDPARAEIGVKPPITS